jgi:Fe-S oxidoreductase
LPLKKRLGRVYFFCDEFTNYNDLSAGIAAIELLELLGYEVLLPLHRESGRAALSKGLLRKAKVLAEENIRCLAPIITESEPLLGIEPSALLSFRDEYPALVDPSQRDVARSLAPNCLLLEEFIAREAASGRISPDQFTKNSQIIHLHGHCHQKALASIDSTVTMLSLPENYSVEVIPSGCCGMAGSFGYEVEHYDLSMKIGELVLFPSVRKLSQEILIAAPGTSCRHQIHDGTARKALHPAEILRAAIFRASI